MEPRRPRPSAALLAISAAVLAFGACSVVGTAPAAPGGGLEIRLPVPAGGSAARTLLPAFRTEVDSVTVTASAAGQVSQSRTIADIGGTVSFQGLPATVWAIAVEARKGGAVIGTGSAIAAVTADSVASLSIFISFAGFDSGTGTLSLPVSWPAGTGVDYLSWAIDGAAPVDAAVSLDAATGLCGATLSASLPAGRHLVSLEFKAGGAAGVPAGRFVEALDIWNGLASTTWIDAAGTARSALSLSAADFLDANAWLGGLVVRDGPSSGGELDTGFSSTRDGTQDLTVLPSSNSISFRPAQSLAGQRISYSWNGAAAVSLASGTSSPVLAFDTGRYANTLAITVRAPNRTSVRTYTFIWHSASLTAGFSLPDPGHQALAFPASCLVTLQGSTYRASCTNQAIAAGGTGWTWYIDGVVEAGQNSPTLVLPASRTAAMRGDYHIACQVDYGDSRYSADYVLRVKACTQLTRANIASAISANMAGNYLLTEDLTLSNWAAIGSVSSKFTGVFDGNGHTINLTMSVNNSNYNTGFIAYVDTAGSVRNLIVTGSIWSNVIATTGNDVQSGVGAITGYNNGTISNCVSRANVSGPQNVGGLVGQNHGIVEDSFATGTVTSLNLALNSGWYIAGGLIGVNTTDATVRRCYATGAVNIQHTGATIIIAGGLIGYDYGYFAGPVRHSNAVSDCYARGAVSGAATANSHYGGFVGYNLNCDYSACYATGVATNRFVGTNDGAANAYAACHSTVAQAGFSTALAAGVLPAGYTPLVWGSDAAAIINGGYPYLRQCGVGTVIP